MEKFSNKLNWIKGVLLIIVISICYSIYYNNTNITCKPTDNINQSNYTGNGLYNIENGKVFVYETDSLLNNYPRYTNINSKYFKALSISYAKDNRNIYYRGNKIEGVDYCSFDVISLSHIDNEQKKLPVDKNKIYYNGLLDEQIRFTKDKYNVYYNGKLFRGADTNSFERVNVYYYKDKYNVYSYYGILMPKMDSKSLKYSKEMDIVYDENGVYILDNLSILGADGESFERLGIIKNYKNDFYKDKNHVYNSMGNIIEGADLNTFTYKGNGLVAYDKNSVYYGFSVIHGADGKTFKNIGKFYSKDKNNIYYTGNSFRDGKNSFAFIVKNADLNSFIDLSSIYYSSQYAKDINHVFYEGKIIENAEIKNCTTYETCKNYYPLGIIFDISTKRYDGVKKITYDKNGVMIHDNLYIVGADGDSFQRLDYYFYKDKNYVYNQKGEIVKGVDLNTFSIKPNTHFYSDKNGVYISGFRFVPGVDISSFKYIGQRYSKDKNNVYYNNYDPNSSNKTLNIAKILIGADAESFKGLEGNNDYAIDKNNVYYNGKIVKNANVNKCINIDECVKNYPSYNIQ